MQLTYFKRHRMEISVQGRLWQPPSVPHGYHFTGWEPSLLEAFAEAKYFSFRDEIDANVFPCLGDWDGCRRLMQEITRKPGFLPEATWLVLYQPKGQRTPEYCGTIQGVRDRAGLGAIQNLGITPGHRDAGLGTALLYLALRGFAASGIRRVHLEVTAENAGAIRLYQRVGFVSVKTVFKAAEVAVS